MSYGTVQAEKITTESGYSLGAGNASSFKNRIINGGMVISQRNGSSTVTITNASTTADNGYVGPDRFYIRAESAAGSKISTAQTTTAPAGFINSQLITSLSAYSIGASEHFGLIQAIEGLNVADLAWGTASAKSVTLSFNVRSSLTGTFGGFVANAGADRCYVFSYTINAANTWETKSITIPGDTTGTWLTNNSVGLYVSLSVGAGSSLTTAAGVWNTSIYRSVTGQTSLVGTNGATFYVTGIQLEVGTVATSFDFRSYGTELALCQRYYWKTTSDPSTLLGVGFCDTSINMICQASMPVPMRTSATLTTSGTASDYRIRWGASNVTACTAVPSYNSTTSQFVRLDCATGASLVAGYGAFLIPNGSNGFLGFSAEL